MYEIMKKVNNFFEKDFEQGNITINNGKLQVNNVYAKGQYIRILDSIMNDGVYQVASCNNGELVVAGNLQDEVFNGYVVGLAVPSDFIHLVEKIKEFDNKQTGIASESIPNYSVTYDTTYKNGLDKFAKQLSIYNKAYQGKYAWLKHLQ